MSAPPLVIAHVLNGLQFGGNENLCLQLIRNSPAEFRHVIININPVSAEMREVFASCRGLAIRDRAYTRDTRLSFMYGMGRDLKEIAADSVLIYAFGVHVFVALAARAAGVERMLVHAGNPPPVDPKQRRVWKKIVWASRVLRVPIMSCSSMVHRELRLLTGGMPAGSDTLYNGVDVEAIEQLAARQRAKKSPDSPRVVGMVARLDCIKDHDTLIKAFARVRARLGDCELWVVGDGERRSALEALARQLQISNFVRFLGVRADVHELLGLMNVFVFSTTRDEGFGIAMAEAMAARTPVVASNVEACREVLAHGEGGRLVAPGDPDELASAITTLLTEPEVARALIDRAYVRAKQQFDVKYCAKRYYERLSARGKRVPRG